MGVAGWLDSSNLHINTERMTSVQENRHSAGFSLTNIPPQKTDSLNLKRFEILGCISTAGARWGPGGALVCFGKHYLLQ